MAGSGLADRAENAARNRAVARVATWWHPCARPPATVTRTRRRAARAEASTKPFLTPGDGLVTNRPGANGVRSRSCSFAPLGHFGVRSIALKDVLFEGALQVDLVEPEDQAAAVRRAFWVSPPGPGGLVRRLQATSTAALEMARAMTTDSAERHP